MLAAVIGAAANYYFDDSSSKAEAPFDFWVLAMSWTPSYCADADNADRVQCRGARGFVVHGLWPQFEHGYPEFCDVKHEAPSRQAIADISEIIPDAGLVRHEWTRHGSCTGLDGDDYLKATREAFERIHVPDRFAVSGAGWSSTPAAIEAAFRAANRDLTGEGMSVECAGGRFTEVRICLTRDFRFRACPQVDRNGCRAASVVVPAAS